MKDKGCSFSNFLRLVAFVVMGNASLSAEPLICVHAFLAELELCNALDEDPPVAEPQDGADARYLAWALHQMAGCPKEPPSDWTGAMDLSLAEPLADVAIVVPRDMDPSVRKDVLGYSQLLAKARIPHVFLPNDEAIEKDLSSFRALIVAGQGPLEGLETEAISAFSAKGGGVLLSSGPSGATKKRDRLGAKGGPCLVRVDKDDPFEVPVEALRLSKEEGSRALVMGLHKKERIPLVVSAEEGLLRSGIPWGAASYQGFGEMGKPYPYEKNAKIEKAALDLVHRILKGPPTLEVGAGEGILVKAYKAGDRYAIHLLNATGLGLGHGESVPTGLPDPAFPPVKGHCVFDFHLPSLSHAWVSSPDYEGERMAWLEWENENTYRVVMPPESLERYSIVYVCEG